MRSRAVEPRIAEHNVQLPAKPRWTIDRHESVGDDLRVVYRLLVCTGASVGHVRGLEDLLPLRDWSRLDNSGDDIE